MRRIRQIRKRRAAGFTLVEVVIAMGILATGLLSIAAMQVQAMRSGKLGKHHSDAASVAFTQIEQMNRLAWNDTVTDPLLNPTWPAFVPLPLPVQRTLLVGGANQVEQTYNVQIRVRDLAPIPPAPPLPITWKEIDVRVLWNEPNAPNRQLTMSTIRHRDPESTL
jgi:prepilin-type N-terminal cleavage/methylation domain-containing protein